MSATTSGVNIHTVGLIVLIVGVVGLLISLFWMLAWDDRERRADRLNAESRRDIADGYPRPRA